MTSPLMSVQHRNNHLLEIVRALGLSIAELSQLTNLDADTGFR